MNFYKTGGKNIVHNYKAAKEIANRLAEPPISSSIPAAVVSNAITRSEFQLLERSKHDIMRLPVFGLVALACGEFTPLIVVLFSNIVPWTCRIPKQILKDRQTLEKRRAISFTNLTVPPPETPGTEFLVRQQLIHISWSLGLSSSMWDWLGGQYPGLPTSLLRRRVERRTHYLEIDDELIRKDGGVGEMSEEEVQMACVQRGIDVVGRPDNDMRDDLESWLSSSEKIPIEHLLLTKYVLYQELDWLLTRIDPQAGMRVEGDRRQRGRFSKNERVLEALKQF